ncbi:MAG TPA: hypothetical protein VHZ04_01835 [Candidatus Paceibacterota bacterium]|jgi:hypothetical protein|nr:hypothetical protein [Candidatus Paceibacterota bacterium]
MNIQEILKQFKNIEPDASYSATSKRAILAVEPGATRKPWTVRRTILTIVETGVAVALTVFFIFIVLGGLPGSELAPMKYSAIDPSSLHAEAEAIDMQIELAQLNYSEPAAESTAPITSVSVSSSTAGATTPATASLFASSTAINGVPGAGASSSATSSATTTVTLDQALQALGQ